MSGDLSPRLSPFREIIADDLFPIFSLNDDLSLNNIKPVPYEHPFNFYDSFPLLSDLTVLPKVDSNSDLQSFLPPSTTQKKKRSKTVKSKREDFSSFLPIRISRKCEHCKTARTPQWRGGPSGKGSLCNACGIRYSSNRLFPEYRPGISSGKGSDLGGEYSNRHKKIMKIRAKKYNSK